MRILIINHEYPPMGGGGGVFARDLAEEWVKMGHKVDLVTSRGSGLERTSKIAGVNVYRAWVGRWLLNQNASLFNLFVFNITAFFVCLKLILKHKYDFINTHFAIPDGFLGFWLQVLLKSKNILTVHGADIYDPTRMMSGHRWWLTRSAIELAINKSNYTVASTKEIKGKIQKYYKINKKINIIPLGFSPCIFGTIAKKEFHKSRILKMVTIGRLIKRKNILLLLKAISRLKKKKKKIMVTIIGDGPDRMKLEKKAKNLGILDKEAIFLGSVKEERKISELNQTDLYISTALHEGFGIVFLEAMQAKLPIIASDQGGQIYFLKEKENALFFKSDNLDDLVEKINYFYKNNEELQRISHKNCKKVKEFYISRIAAKYIRLVA